jgi:hypothetical protein
MINFSEYSGPLGQPVFRINSTFTGKCKKEKEVKEKSESALILRTPGRAIVEFSTL